MNTKHLISSILLYFASLIVYGQSHPHYNGDLNHDGTVNIQDIIQLRHVIHNHDNAEVVSARNGSLFFQNTEEVLELPDFNGYEYVDLGLKNSQGCPVFWAKCNIGSEIPEEAGLFFVWGETQGYSTDEISLYSNGVRFSAKNNKNLRKDSGVLALQELDLTDDAAHAYWGGNWHLPSSEEWSLLINGCDWEWVTQSKGLSGFRISNKHDHSQYIYLPMPGVYSSSKFQFEAVGRMGLYLSSTFCGMYTDNARNYSFSYHQFSEIGQIRAVCTAKSPMLCKVDSIVLNTTHVELQRNESFTLNATVIPEEADGLRLQWTTSDARVARIDTKESVSVSVNAVSEGTATLTAWATDGSGKKASCTVSVKAHVGLGREQQMIKWACPQYFKNQFLHWTSSDGSIVSVDENGVVRGVNFGTATITATDKADDRLSVSCTFVVDSVLVHSVSIGKDTLQLEVNHSRKLHASIYPEDATDLKLEWLSSDPTVATVSADGVVKALHKGRSFITVRSMDGTNCTSSSELFVGNFYNGHEYVDLGMRDSLNRIVYWATCNVGALKPERVGSYFKRPLFDEILSNWPEEWRIPSADEWSWLKDSCVWTDVTVNGVAVYKVTNKKDSNSFIYLPHGSYYWDNSRPQEPVMCRPVFTEFIKVDNLDIGDSFTVGLGRKEFIYAHISPYNSTDPHLKWASSDTTIAIVEGGNPVVQVRYKPFEVSVSGAIYAKGIGSATITASTTDGSGVVASVQVTVKPVLVDRIYDGIFISSGPPSPPEGTRFEGDIHLLKGQHISADVKTSPNDANNSVLEYSSSNPSVIAMRKGSTFIFYEAVGVGSASIIISATDGSGVTYVRDCHVYPQFVREISLASDLRLLWGNSKKLYADISPSSADNQILEWRTSDPSVATVSDDGTVTAVGLGEAVISAWATDDFSLYWPGFGFEGERAHAECRVTVEMNSNSHSYVDLGMRDSLGRPICWATTNIGASRPEETGRYYAWGELDGYVYDPNALHYFDWTNYKYCRYNQWDINKYTIEDNQTRGIWYSDGQFKGDGKSELSQSDDVARYWKGDWRIPSVSEMKWLVDSCNWVSTTLNGVPGYRVENKSDASKYIFLPAAGRCYSSFLNSKGSVCYYWTSSLSDMTQKAYQLKDNSIVSDDRCDGLPIRPVCGPK